MRTIYKYRLGITTRVPFGINDRVVHVGMQGGLMNAWVEHQLAPPPTMRTLSVLGTGHEIPAGWTHVGTTFDEPYVWHIYLEPLDG